MNLSRLRFHPESKSLLYQPKAAHEVDDEPLGDPLEFVAQVLIHIPEPRKHLVHFYGAYANRLRSARALQDHSAEGLRGCVEASPPRRALRKRWAELIYRIYEVDPLTCLRCGAQMKILAFITEPSLIRRILDHLDHKASQPRAPPHRTELQ